MPSKGISGTQVTLSQCHHISQGEQNNPKREPKEASLIIWLPSRTFPLLNSSKGQTLHGPMFFSINCILSFTSPPLWWVCIQESGRDKFPTHAVANIAWFRLFIVPLLKVTTIQSSIEKVKIWWNKAKKKQKKLFSAQQSTLLYISIVSYSPQEGVWWKGRTCCFPLAEITTN